MTTPWQQVSEAFDRVVSLYIHYVCYDISEQDAEPLLCDQSEVAVVSSTYLHSCMPDSQSSELAYTTVAMCQIGSHLRTRGLQDPASDVVQSNCAAGIASSGLPAHDMFCSDG